MDKDLQSIQEARRLVEQVCAAKKRYKTFTQEQVDRIVAAMARAGEQAAERLAHMAHEETGFGRPESKKTKNLFATKILHERMAGMKTVGVIRKLENDTIWEIAIPMGVVVALIPSTNPTSTAMYKAIIAAKARCAIVMSPHPRATGSTAEALRVVAEAAYEAGAPEGLFGCMTTVALSGTNALLEHPDIDLILATGGSAMVKAAYSKGKPAYGVGSGNVPVYVDRSANVAKAAADLLYGVSFDWGTLCSTERSVIADYPIKAKLIEAMKREGAYFLNDGEKDKLRRFVLHKGRLNLEQVGQSPHRIATLAGFKAPHDARALVAEVEKVGKEEPLSMETLSPILSFYTTDGWQAGCDRCIEVLHFGGIGHTLGLHCTNERVIEAFALQKPSMRIVVNTVAALGSVGYTNRLFPSMTLGPGTLGGSITSDNVSPMHLLNIKRLAFETNPIHPADGVAGSGRHRTTSGASRSWMDEIEARLLARAGNPVTSPDRPSGSGDQRKAAAPVPSLPTPASSTSPSSTTLALPDTRIEQLVQQFKK
ncbi:MAG: aldehyde dehydrogenase family protein [Rhodothermales bacterium]